MANRAERINAERIFKEALEAASPRSAIKKNLKVLASGRRGQLKAGRFYYNLNSFKNIYVIGAGKPVCPMAKAIEEVLLRRITEGVVVTKYGHSLGLKRIKVLEADHPIPDNNGIKGARALLELADRAGAGDLVICLISGGASALLPAPRPGITLRDKQLITERLINSGADIHEINSVRKHLSMIKGGGLLKRIHPAASLTLIVSDVVGDDPSTIASGPTSPDPSTYADALGVLKRYGLIKSAPPAVMKLLKRGKAGLAEETPKPGGAVFKSCRNIIVASNIQALRAAKRKAESLGYRTIILSSRLIGPTREAAGFLSAVIREVKSTGNPIKRPACILMGGETTIKVEGKGKGGRNQEFALAAALSIAGLDGVTILSAGTDGTDGPTDAAGAFADSRTVKRAQKSGMEAKKFLERNDSYRYFKSLHDLLITGPTGTNVMDMVIALIR